jgi:hypothetical protein
MAEIAFFMLKPLLVIDLTRALLSQGADTYLTEQDDQKTF